jgi:hypothetical protein
MRRTVLALLLLLIPTGLFVGGFYVATADADTRRQAALFVVNPYMHPQEDGFDCGPSWVMDSYGALHNGGAHIVCVKLNHGETRDGYYMRRDAGKVEQFQF